MKKYSCDPLQKFPILDGTNFELTDTAVVVKRNRLLW